MGFILLKRKTGWRIEHRVDNGKAVKARILSEAETAALGFSPTMSAEEARKALAVLRADEKARRLSERAVRAKAKETPASAWLPTEWVEEFERDILPEARLTMPRWIIVKNLISKLPLPPDEWHWRPDAIFQALKNMGAGPDYAKRLRRYFNKWGAFYCRKKRLPFMPIERPDRATKIALRRASAQKHGDRSTKPLLLSDLARAKLLLPEDQYWGLHIMFWCLLRPRELRTLTDGKWHLYRLQLDDTRFRAVVHVFQEKLAEQAFEDRLCWKAVPLVEPEQLECLPVLERRAFAFPNVKKLKQAGINVTARSARRGAVAIFQHRGYSQACIEHWLGHIGRDTTPRYYETKAIAFYEPPIKKAS